MPSVAADSGSFAAPDGDDDDYDQPKKATSQDPFFDIVDRADLPRLREILGELAPRGSSLSAKSMFFDRFVEADRQKLRELFGELDPDSTPDQSDEARIAASRALNMAMWVSTNSPSARPSAVANAVADYVARTAKQTLANGAVAISDEPLTPAVRKNRDAKKVGTWGDEKKHDCK